MHRNIYIKKNISNKVRFNLTDGGSPALDGGFVGVRRVAPGQQQLLVGHGNWRVLGHPFLQFPKRGGGRHLVLQQLAALHHQHLYHLIKQFIIKLCKQNYNTSGGEHSLIIHWNTPCWSMAIVRQQHLTATDTKISTAMAIFSRKISTELTWIVDRHSHKPTRCRPSKGRRCIPDVII